MYLLGKFTVKKTHSAATPWLALAALGFAVSGCSSLPAFPNPMAVVPHAFDQIAALPDKIGHAFPSTPVGKSGDPAGDLVRQGDALRAKGDLDGAAASYAKAIAADPKSLAAETRLGQTEIARNRDDAAFNAYSAAQALAPKDPEVAFRLGELDLMRGNASAALDQFNMALETRKDDPKLYNATGVAYSLAGQYDLARQNYELGLGVAPDDPALRNNYGLMQLSTGDLTGALATLSSLVLSPQATDRYRINLALVYTALGKTDEAVKAANGLIDEAGLKQALAVYYRPSPVRQADAPPSRAVKGRKSAAKPAAPTEAAATAEPVPAVGLPGVHFTGASANGGRALSTGSEPGEPVAALPTAPPPPAATN